MTALLVVAAGLGVALPAQAARSVFTAAKLQVVTVKASGTPVASGTRVKATVVLNNPGATEAAGRALLYLVAKDDRVYKLGKVEVPVAVAGERFAVSTTNAAPKDAPAGKYSFSVCLTPRPTGDCSTSRRTVTIQPAQLAAAPATLNLGGTLPGATSASQVVTITNSGHSRTGALSVTSNTSTFKVRSSDCPTRLEAGASCQLSVAFSPSAVGSAAGSLKITGRRGASTTVSLTGTGTGTAGLLVSPAAFAFDSTLVGSSSAVKAFVVTNTGTAVSSALAVSISSGGPVFAITGNNCTAPLAPSASCTVSVRFSPTTRGAATGRLSVSDGSSTSGLSATGSDLSGTGQMPASLSLTPGSAGFGDATIGTTTTTQTITMTNAGDVATGVPAVQLTGPDAAQFTIVNNTCTAAVAAGSNCTVDIAFAPTTGGPKTAQVVASASPGGSDTTDLTGTGQTASQLSISNTAYDFGYTDNPTEKILTITNNGGATSGVPAVDLTGSGAFTITTDTCTAALPGGASCTVGVTYTGSGTTQQSAHLSVTAAPGGVVTTDLTGSPLALTVAPAARNFGGVPVGSTSAVQSFVLTNHRLTPVQIDGEGVTGPFSLDTSCFPVVIPAGGTCTFSAHFAPTSPGAVSGSVDYFANGATAQVQLSGTGLTPAFFALSSSTLDFGAYAPGDTGTQQLTITNTGTETSSTVGFSVTGTNAADFNVSTTDCPTTLPGGASCTATVDFTANALGDKTASLTVAGAPGGTAAVTALAAPAGVTLYPATHDYGAVAVGGAAYFTFRVVNTTNNGEDMNSASSGPPFPLELNQDFTCVLQISTIQPHRWCTMTLSFKPQSTGPFSTTLTAGGANFNTSSQLLGTGVPASSLVASRKRPEPQPTSVELVNGAPVVRRD